MWNIFQDKNSPVSHLQLERLFLSVAFIILSSLLNVCRLWLVFTLADTLCLGETKRSGLNASRWCYKMLSPFSKWTLHVLCLDICRSLSRCLWRPFWPCRDCWLHTVASLLPNDTHSMFILHPQGAHRCLHSDRNWNNLLVQIFVHHSGINPIFQPAWCIIYLLLGEYPFSVTPVEYWLSYGTCGKVTVMLCTLYKMK